MKSRSLSLDQFGIFASGLCVLHCAAVALLPGALIALGLSEVFGHELETALVIVAAGIALGAAIAGGKRHGSWRVLGVMGLGATGLLLTRIVEASEVHGLEVGLSIGAGFFLIVGHLLNLRASRCHQDGC